MKILLITFYNKLEIEVHPGVGVLSTALKKAGHETKLYPYMYFSETDLITEISCYKPDFICISATSMSKQQVIKLGKFFKQITSVPILLGGIFPILEPDEAIKIIGIDAMCIGEGTDGILEYINNIHPATNFVYYNGQRGKYKKWNACALNEIDYELFFDCSKIRGLKIANKLDYWTSYTCEFKCSFCCSNHLRKITGLNNKPRLSIPKAIKELDKLITKNDYKKIHLRDPLFIGVRDIDWVSEFLELYKKQIGLPYTCNVRADIFNENIAFMLKDTGCSKIKMGLESGSEYMRNKVLFKGETDEEFVESIKLIKKYDIKLSLNAMLGIPYETLDTAFKTIEMLKELSPNESFLHIYQPWAGLKIPNDIVNFIKIIRAPAIDDISSRGHMIKEYNENNNFYFDKEKIEKEFIYTPILDQPQFPYNVALKLQEEFILGDKK
ncbi:MAG: Radical domain protein [Clostridiaceae bacterium]|jgi:radical SAM superfamily enzyme YgiQ (UPF0313 family)|nr:Radical domain protein [Clostridiaceae bacterium]